MAYYNSAALRGGSSIQDAIDQISGGWDLGNYDASTGNFRNGALGTERDELNIVANDIKQRYVVPDRVMDQAFQDAFNYDSALVTGDADYLRAWRRTVPGPRQKFARYVRKKIHTFGSAPQHYTTQELNAKRDRALQRRQAAVQALNAGPWVGSDPYTGRGQATRGAFRYAYPGNGSPWTAEQRRMKRSQRPKIPLPQWYTDLGLSRRRRPRLPRPRRHGLNPAALVINNPPSPTN